LKILTKMWFVMPIDGAGDTSERRLC